MFSASLSTLKFEIQLKNWNTKNKEVSTVFYLSLPLQTVIESIKVNLIIWISYQCHVSFPWEQTYMYIYRPKWYENQSPRPKGPYPGVSRIHSRAKSPQTNTTQRKVTISGAIHDIQAELIRHVNGSRPFCSKDNHPRGYVWQSDSTVSLQRVNLCWRYVKSLTYL